MVTIPLVIRRRFHRRTVARDQLPAERTLAGRTSSPRRLRSLQEALGADFVGDGVPLTRLWATCPERMERLERSYLRAQQVLPPSEEEYTLHLVKSVIVTACGLLASDGKAEQIKALLDSRVDEVAGYVQRREQNLARRAYLRGLFTWLLLTLGLMVVIASIGWLVVPRFRQLSGASGTLPTSEYLATRDLMFCVGGGAIGATVSCLQRLSAMEHIDFEAVERGAGRYRILLGWLFAAALAFFIKGGVIHLFDDPSAGLLTNNSAQDPLLLAKSWCFWGAMGFLAGFNERWVANLVSRQPPPQPAAPGEAAHKTKQT
jgi:hypothetical protein